MGAMEERWGAMGERWGAMGERCRGGLKKEGWRRTAVEIDFPGGTKRPAAPLTWGGVLGRFGVPVTREGMRPPLSSGISLLALSHPGTCSLFPWLPSPYLSPLTLPPAP